MQSRLKGSMRDDAQPGRRGFDRRFAERTAMRCKSLRNRRVEKSGGGSTILITMPRHRLFAWKIGGPEAPLLSWLPARPRAAEREAWGCRRHDQVEN